jgi:hypothetical protein
MFQNLSCLEFYELLMDALPWPTRNDDWVIIHLESFMLTPWYARNLALEVVFKFFNLYYTLNFNL